MAVNLLPPDPAAMLPVAGVTLGFAEAGIRKAGRRDLMLMQFAPGTRVAGVFTQNSFAAAPVLVCREHLRANVAVRAIVVNAGNANCGTGEQGLAAARATCSAAARLVGCDAKAVLPFSTGIILEHLPVNRIEAALPACVKSLAPNHWADAAAAIMTTDTVPKGASTAATIGGKRVHVTGIAKGVGMLQPNMATMLAYVATDAAIAQPLMLRLVKEVADRSFNRVTVDGDTSTNDSFVLIATAQAGNAEITSADHADYVALREAVLKVAIPLAQAIARDGEGATKFITIRVSGAQDDAQAARVAKAIAHSPLVKTAFFASDPNLGRLIMAIGNAGVADLDTSRVSIWLGDVRVLSNGGRDAAYREEDGARVMKPAEIDIHVALGRGSAEQTVWTCDFSYDYVKINAEYRT
ncbi:MAG: bifunctional glutamate N-acetyltransferase/amino-acid acetyltransferase ArgJ [Betaproteobacteria bacterium]|nr:bifunctional glutamate N-acetyltransferase/amino-acid acetyltransferase ArgJ [Betaproteobacteria bacterium]